MKTREILERELAVKLNAGIAVGYSDLLVKFDELPEVLQKNHHIVVLWYFGDLEARRFSTAKKAKVFAGSVRYQVPIIGIWNLKFNSFKPQDCITLNDWVDAHDALQIKIQNPNQLVMRGELANVSG